MSLTDKQRHAELVNEIESECMDVAIKKQKKESNMPETEQPLVQNNKPVHRCTRCGVIVEEGRILCDMCRFIGTNPCFFTGANPCFPIWPYYAWCDGKPVYFYVATCGTGTGSVTLK